ncbi:S-adenosyl-L-methionine-dependent methyltransferase [Bimuria novae-zelandiae CBS 107.79]|uniref:S-adenosyl-L-methionine-dependent methyltransferase n=1 Tax=Bimuria novae-zelandiae CBS 107.79 TaxID=1447943 RepID=A0A6A5V431_9PLEO|nr:S-adenosyl-L-methionine-dependent methyltransferase [Bimuria novae-zelandiae CBS 107.79]
MSSEQAEKAVLFYEQRSYHYDDSWHSDFTKRFASEIKIEPGQHVLDLACGTGLLTFLESEKVGRSGNVIGIDVTPGMLRVAELKKKKEEEKYSNVEFHHGDVLKLQEIEAVKGKQFDVITIASALVLFPDPQTAIEHWSEYLKPGGIIALDSTHPRNLIAGMVLERTARRLDLQVPYNREWSQNESSLKNVLESAGLEVEKVITIENQAGYGKRQYELEQWDDFFVENVIVKDVAKTFANNDIRRKAQGIYKEEWERLAVNGKVEEFDSVFLGIARKPADGSRHVSKSSSSNIVFEGSCRCGGVRYTSTAPPSDITLCHCRACQQISGSGFLPFVNVERKAFDFTHTSTLKTLVLSEFAERFFCTGCGAPIAMSYKFEESHFGIVFSSVNLETLQEKMPVVGKHIFLREKAPWVILPDDGAKRMETFEFAKQLGME